MEPLKQFKKDPQAVLDYGIDWGADGRGWLPEGDTISASSWTITGKDGAELGAGPLVQDSDTHDASTTTVWLSGGTVGETYDVTNHITTAAGRQDDRTIRITVQEQ